MKKITCFLALLVMVGYSQQTESTINIGIIGGLNFNSAQVEIVEEGADVSSNTGFGIGGVIDWKLNQTFGLRLEPMYLQKGIGKTELDISPGINWYIDASYFEIPVLIKAEFGEDIKTYVLVGPSFGLLFDTEVTAEINNITFKGDAKSATESIDFGISLGGGINYPIKGISFFIEGCYTYGISNDIKDGTFDMTAKNVSDELEWSKDTDKLINRGFRIMTGITFPL